MNKNIYNQVSTTKIVWNILHSYGFKLFAFCFFMPYRGKFQGSGHIYESR